MLYLSLVYSIKHFQKIAFNIPHKMLPVEDNIHAWFVSTRHNDSAHFGNTLYNQFWKVHIKLVH